MVGELFIRGGGNKKLEEFARYIFSVLSITFREIRYSENVSGGNYVVGFGVGLTFTIEIADLQDFEDYEYLLYINPIIRNEQTRTYNFDDLADTIAIFLASNGLTIARPLDLPVAGTPSVLYSAGETASQSK